MFTGRNPVTHKMFTYKLPEVTLSPDCRGPVTEQGRGWFTINYYRKDSPFLSLEVPPPYAHLLGSKCPPPEERRLSMPETGEKEMNCLFKSYTDLE